MKKNLYKYLAGNDYPGRGIVLGKSPDGQKPLTRPSSRTRTSSSTTLC